MGQINFIRGLIGEKSSLKAEFELKAAIYRQNIFSGFQIGPSIFVFNSLGKN